MQPVHVQSSQYRHEMPHNLMLFSNKAVSLLQTPFCDSSYDHTDFDVVINYWLRLLLVLQNPCLEFLNAGLETIWVESESEHFTHFCHLGLFRMWFIPPQQISQCLKTFTWSGSVRWYKCFALAKAILLYLGKASVLYLSLTSCDFVGCTLLSQSPITHRLMRLNRLQPHSNFNSFGYRSIKNIYWAHWFLTHYRSIAVRKKYYWTRRSNKKKDALTLASPMAYTMTMSRNEIVLLKSGLQR